MSITTQQFRVALSFPGEHRDFVEAVAERLAEILPREQIFYDRWHEAELAVPNLDTLLQGVYHDQAELIVVFLCAEYEKKEWCGLEWRAVRDLLKQRQAPSIMPVRFDDTEIPGLFSIDGCVWAKGRKPEAIADVILKRLHLSPPPRPRPPRVSVWLVIPATTLALGLLVGWFFYFQPLLDRHVSQARRYLSSGRYTEAAVEFRQVLRLAPWQQQARFDLAIAELGQVYLMDEHPDAEKLHARLDALLRELPDNPDLLVLDGIRLYHQNNLPMAEKRYLKAIKLAPDLAAAWFNLGVLHENPDEAEPLFQKAQDLAPGSAVYRDARAAVDLERGRYGQAIAAYDTIDRYPLAKLEQAKAYWALGELDKAESRQKQALAWLNDAKVAALPWNQYPWDVETASLRSSSCKQYYAALALAATRYLRGGQQEQPAPGACGLAPEVRQAVAEDLRRHASLKPAQTQASQRFVAHLLGQ